MPASAFSRFQWMTAFGKPSEFANGLMPRFAAAAVDDWSIGMDPLLDGLEGIS
jgi:hypothetical protein